MSAEWWKKTVVYQIYPRSFKDSNDDGIGDLNGIIEKLDYIKSLGVETIWLCPIYPSPQKDFGYDITDYTSINPEYGTMKDFENLLESVHELGMKLILDMVLNHTSDEHPWFLESKASRDNPKRNWYVWRDGKKPNGKKPPNNWRSLFGGSAWSYDRTTDQWYLHQFAEFQPDLNYRNPEVKETMFNVLRFWLDKGVDGFRLDAISTIYEDSMFRDNPFSFHFIPSDNYTDALFQKKIYTINTQDTYNFCKELRTVMDEYEPERFLVGEAFGSIKEIRRFCGEKNDGLHLVFIFKTLRTKFNAPSQRRLIKEMESYFAHPCIPTYVYSNHDRIRHISRLGNDVKKAKLNTLLQLTVRGVPFIYYGEEIGMVQARIPLKEAKDCVAKRYRWAPQFAIDMIRMFYKESLNRDESRTPMQWNCSKNAGFSNVEPWLPVHPKYKKINVEVEEKDEESMLNFYRRLLQVRRENVALLEGALEFIKKYEESKNILAYRRKSKNQTLEIYLNFSTKIHRIDIDGNVIFATSKNVASGKTLNLKEYDGAIVDIT